MKKIKHIILAFIFTLSSMLIVVGAPNAHASQSPGSPGGGGQVCGTVNGHILTFPTWYRGLSQDPATCVIKLTSFNQIWQIVLNLLEVALQIAGYAAAGYMIWGGFKYMKSQGNPQNIASAKSTLMNAAIGLGIALSAVGIVNFVSSRF